MYMSVFLISVLVSLIMILIGVAFITLLERKILGYMQIRLGPVKVGTLGILQPFSDAIKLYTKEYNFPLISSFLTYSLCPVFGLILSLTCWFCLPYFQCQMTMFLSLLFFMSTLGMGVYIIMMSGWISNSTYSILGGIRCVAQTISYEVTLLFIIISLIILNGTLNFFCFFFLQKYIWYFFLIPNFFMWLIVSLAELNRTPFDFAEGESELVSGFNVEYSSGGFALIFMAEYSMIIFLSFVTCLLFLGSNLFSFFFYIQISLICFFFIWIRATLPRFRYDKLMYLTWKVFLPSSLNLMGMNFCLSLLI